MHHHRCGRVLRVGIRRDQLAEKSFAAVEVLTPWWTWTELASQPPLRWHIDAPPVQGADQETLMPVGEALLERAAAILAPSNPDPLNNHRPQTRVGCDPVPSGRLVRRPRDKRHDPDRRHVQRHHPVAGRPARPDATKPAIR